MLGRGDAVDTTMSMSMDDLVEEVVPLRGRELRVLRPRDSEALIDEDAFEHEEFLPYWAELWPSGVALARAVEVRALRGRSVVELGCGLGLPAIAAALAGGRVLATDWSPAAVARTADNARRNGAQLETLVCSWADPAPLHARAPFELVLASDVLYESRDVAPLLALLASIVAPGGEAWIADPGRASADRFLERAAAAFAIETASVAEIPNGGIHRLRPLA
jgi:predicted nicotinamide N-methyase